MTTIALLVLAMLQASASTQPSSCRELPEYSRLDFWVGDWDVYLKEQKVGSNRITRVLAGCAVTEEWEDVKGGRGMSLFYVHPRERTWKQMWVTDRAVQPGGTKEKTLTTVMPDGGLRFEGEVAWGSKVVRDRTTLTPLPDGRVRQVIEVSQDGGRTWLPTFDGLYVRKGPRRP